MTLEELYQEILGSDELKEEVAQATESEKSIVAFLRKHGCDATLDEFKTFVATQGEGRDMSLEELNEIAGGDWIGALSALSTLSCALVSIVNGKMNGDCDF